MTFQYCCYYVTSLLYLSSLQLIGVRHFLLLSVSQRYLTMTISRHVIEMTFSLVSKVFLEIHFVLILRRWMSTFYLNVGQNSSKRSSAESSLARLPPLGNFYNPRFPLIGKFLLEGLYLPAGSLSSPRENFKRYYPIHFSRFSHG